MAEKQLIELFHACDKKGTGKIGPEEFENLCARYGIESSGANVLFADLDHDGDGEINLDDFAWGFRDYLNGNLDAADQKNHFSPEKRELIERRRSDARSAWSHLVEGIGETAVKKFLNTSGKKLEELYHELQNAGSPPELVTHFEKAFCSLMQDVKRLHEENQKLEQMFNKEKEIHLERLKGLEEEIDAQVAKVEAEAREEARLKYEQEKKEMRERMEREKAELEAHLRLFQKVNKVLTQKKEENNSLKHAAAFENEELRSLLSDTRTNMAVLHSEMARIKADYETKCRELNSHQEVVMQYLDQNKHVRQQLALLQEANKNLQDTNDSLLTVMETSCGKTTPFCCSRAGSDSDSNASEKAQTIVPFPIKQLIIQNDLFNEQNSESGAEYVIQRLMEDIGNRNSGRSTLRDPIECDSDHKSIQEEFSDAESQFKSLESDDSKHSHPSLRRRINKSDYICMTPVSMMSFEATGDPDRTYKVVLAGDAAVGKSCFIHRFCKGNFANKLGSTLGVDFQIKTIRVDEKNIALQLWDTAGQERFRSMTKTYFRRADGVVLLYDVTSERSFINIRQWIQSINETTDKEIPILICGNKVDLRDEARKLGANCVDTRHGEALARDHCALFFETSSKTGKNIFDALITISREMLLREDVEVQTSALKVSKVERPLICCKK